MTEDSSKTPTEAGAPEAGKPKRFRRPDTAKLKDWKQRFLANKKRNIPLATVGLLVVLMVLPLTRYHMLGLFIKKSIEVQVLDSVTTKPVSEAEVTVDGKTGMTDADGKLRLDDVRVGSRPAKVTKKYYKDLDSKVSVPLKTADEPHELSLEASGRQVNVLVKNKVSGQPAANATIEALGTEATTDTEGEAVIVLPPEQATAEATISGEGFNETKVTLTVDGDETANTFKVTPSGKVYFLSKLSGKVDVVKTNLDGTDRQTVLAGTGQEEDGETVLLASRDWKYLALLARRDSDKAKLYLINTAEDKLSVIDEGDARFDLVGWYDDQFTYVVTRNSQPVYETRYASIKSYKASSDKLTILDYTDKSLNSVSALQYTTISVNHVQLFNNQVVYAKNWNRTGGGGVLERTNELARISFDGTNRKIIATLNASYTRFNSIKRYEPQELYVQAFNYATDYESHYYELEGNFEYSRDDDITNEEFYSAYPTYLVSPSGKRTLWSDTRDGKNTILVGDENAKDEEAVARLSEMTPYGWYTEDYLLLSKNGSELYIMTSSPGHDEQLKITDYHKPYTSYQGYGYGYGGL